MSTASPPAPAAPSLSPLDATAPATPPEARSLRTPFVALSAALVLCTTWAIWDEVRARRPWKAYQRQFFALAEGHLRADLARAERRLEAPGTREKVAAARAELAGARDALTGSPEQRRAFDRAVAAERTARVAEEEARLLLGFERSEADALYYRLREARHEGGRGEAAARTRVEAQDVIVRRRASTHAAAEAALRNATAARAAFERRRDVAQARLDELQGRVSELRSKLAAYTAFPGKQPALEQIWIPGLPNSWGAETVDRCPSCHVAVNRAGFSAPAEVLAARRDGLPATDLRQRFAVDEEVVDGYQVVHDRICAPAPPPAGGDVATGGHSVPSAFGEGTSRPPEAPLAPAQPHPAGPPLVTPADPADACRPVATYRRWLALSRAYCARGERPLATTRFRLLDAGGAPVAAVPGPLRVQALARAPGRAAEEADPLAAVSRACAAPEVIAAFEAAERADGFDVPPLFRTHPARAELLGSAHPPERFGCTVCHGGEGAQTKGVMHREFRHGADDAHWNDPLTDEVRVLGRRFPGAFVEAKCERCHREELTVPRAPLLTRGKKLFVEAGCWGCHPTDGYNDLPKRGPPLTGLAAKTSPGWLETWTAHPRGWRPGTRMPSFWPGAVDPESAPRLLGESFDEAKARHRRLRDAEVSAITAYLWLTSGDVTLRPPPRGSAERGRRLFDTVGCRACHVAEAGSTARRSEASETRDYAPNLWNVGDKATAGWLFRWVKNPRALWPETKMPDLRLSDAEAADVTAYLVTLRGGARHPDPPQYAPAERPRLEELAREGKALVAKYGCSGCHVVAGFEGTQKIAADLTDHGRKDPKLLDFGDVAWFAADPARRTYASFVWTKLHSPRLFGYELVEPRMPQFDLSDDEALALLTFLKGQTGERDATPREVLPGLDGPKLAVLTGERLVFWNGCRNCHVVEGRGGVVRDLFEGEGAPPVLSNLGAKLQPAWLFEFLKRPTPVRPWLRIRMPTYHLSDEDAGTLVKYFASASRQSFPYLTVDSAPPSAAAARAGLALFRDLQCASCHAVGAGAPVLDPAAAAPDLFLARRRLRPDFIPRWLADPNAQIAGTRMPAYWDPDPASPAPHAAFGGDKRAQMEALRDVVMHLGEPGLDFRRSTP